MTVLVALSGLVGAGAERNVSGQSRVVHGLAVVDTQFAAAQADAVIADMGDILQERDGSRDVSCNVAFVRGRMDASPARDTIRIRKDVVDLARDLAQEFGQAFLNGKVDVVVIVDRINWCGGIVSADGCTYTFRDGFSFFVVKRSAENRGIVWAHEFGHMRGLEHRHDARAVMYPRVVFTSRQVDEEECGAYRRP